MLAETQKKLKTRNSHKKKEKVKATGIFILRISTEQLECS